MAPIMDLQCRSVETRQRLLLPESGTFHDQRSQLVRVVQLALAFCVIFMPFSAVQNFQTSQADPIMGARALCLLYVTFTFANLFSGQLVQLAGLRASMFMGSLSYAAFVFSNIESKRWMVYSSAVMLGIGAAVLWTAQGAFVTRVSLLHDSAASKQPGSSLGIFNGMFFAVFQANQLFGNLATACMFRFDFDVGVIFKVCTLICCLGALLLLFISAPPVTKDRFPTLLSMLSTIRCQFHDSRLVLLVPYMLLNGATSSFIIGDLATFPPSHTTRFLVMAVWGGCDALASMVSGKLADLLGRTPVILLGVGAHSLVTCLVAFSNIRTSIPWCFALAFGFGCVDAVYNTTVYAVIGSLFSNPESAFANFKLFQSLMTALAFFYREYTDVETRSVIIAVMIVVASDQVCLGLLRRKAGRL